MSKDADTDATYENGYRNGYEACRRARLAADLAESRKRLETLHDIDVETADTIIGAARLLQKGTTTRHTGDALNRLAAQLHRGAEAELMCLELEEAHKVLVAALRKEIDTLSLHQDDMPL